MKQLFILSFILTYVLFFIYAFDFFMWIQVTVKRPFISAWKIPFATSCRVVLLETNYLSFYKYEMIFISPFISDG